MSSATPADVLARRRHLTLTGDADGLADLYAPDAVMEFCFHGPPGVARAHRGPGGDPRVLPAGHGAAVADGGLRGGGAIPDAGPGGGDRGDAGEGDRHYDGPVDHGNIHPGSPDPGRSYRALPRLRRSPGLAGRDRGTRVRGADTGPGCRVVRRVEAGAGEPAVVLEAGMITGPRPGSGSCRCWPRMCALSPTTGRG